MPDTVSSFIELLHLDPDALVSLTPATADNGLSVLHACLHVYLFARYFICFISINMYWKIRYFMSALICKLNNCGCW